METTNNKNQDSSGQLDAENELEQLAETCKLLYEERKKQIKLTLDKRWGKLFKARITKGKWRGTKELDYFDKVTLSVRIDSRYKSISRLNTGEKNAAMMVLLMNQGAFGPLIMDEPEQYLDVKSIVGMLIPRMRALKTQQQIICVTKDEHILISGDAEQVIATQSEKKPELITGDINNDEIQKQIVEIFEGDKTALREKVRKLGRILE